jgi:hypothetical protein
MGGGATLVPVSGRKSRRLPATLLNTVVKSAIPPDSRARLPRAEKVRDVRQLRF